ncbi:ABC transporter ATP-binding protein [Brochothrix thermosphacta]|uniref:ABC transporter ATP-binding protein n=1 Tax=Brochothrix thermosphacta TaxID=2756 RepID=UPI0003E85EF4|nr:ABC transporter ATP-binding protein [Brochothrix thermosphacta]EUJ38693.1 ABC transporter [Brochothrix thermosphacta DSM 20171 = FSL F6-1036]ODJ49726.1 hypothetical protein BFR34_04420 [Brochothrix thermosphacta DSM 20171 = FSL F6-1036]
MIELKDVTYKYQGREEPSIKGLNLKIPQGQVVVITGKSGSGKTTLTRLMNSLVPHYYEGQLQGKVTVNGIDTATQPLWKLPFTVGSVLQDPRSQFFGLHVKDEVVFGAENHAVPQADIQTRLSEVSEALKINHLLNHSLYQLSSGEKQRVALSSVQMMSPNVYLFDEPSSNLDAEMAVFLTSFIEKLKKQGATLIISEHRLHYLMGVMDRLVVLKQGEIVADIPQIEVEEYLENEGKNQGLRQLAPKVAAYEAIDTTKLAPLVSVEKLVYQPKDSTFKLNIAELNGFPGEVIAIVGGNGAGKTTLARALAGFIKPKLGVVKMNGIKMNQRKRMQHSWFVAQDADYQLFSESVAKELILGNEKQPNITEKAALLLDKMGLTHLKMAHPMQLSGGEKQRLSISVGLIRERDCLILDEPTSGLDGYHMEQMADYLRTPLFKEKCIFIVTHDEAFIASCCTRVVRLKDGKIIEDKPTVIGESIKEMM